MHRCKSFPLHEIILFFLILSCIFLLSLCTGCWYKGFIHEVNLITVFRNKACFYSEYPFDIHHLNIA